MNSLVAGEKRISEPRERVKETMKIEHNNFYDEIFPHILALFSLSLLLYTAASRTAGKIKLKIVIFIFYEEAH